MAWTGNFKNQIADLAGTLTVTDDVAILQWLRDGCYDVLTKAVIKSGPEEVWKFVVKSGNVVNGTPVDVDEIRTIAGVVRNSVFATKGMWGLKDKYADTNSIYAAVANSPIWYLDNDTLIIKPNPSGGEPANYYYAPEYAIAAWDGEGGVSSINNYPSEYYYYVMLYAAIQVLSRKMLDSTTPTTVATLGITAVTPDVPTIAAISYSGPGTSDVSLAPTISTTAYVLPSAGTAFASRLADFSALAGFSVNATAPTAISAPSIVSSAISTVALANITGSVPSYNSVVTAGTLGALASLAIDDLSITAAPPNAFTPQTVTYTPPTAAVVGAQPVITDIIAIGNASVTSITGASSEQPAYIGPDSVSVINAATELAKMKDYINNEEDNELSAAKGQEISQMIAEFNAKLQKFSADMTDSMNTFNGDNTVYAALVQQATQNANTTNSHAIQNMQKELQREQSVVQTGSTEHATALQVAQANAANTQAKNMQDAIQVVQAIIADNTVNMQEWSQSLAQYQAEVGTEVQEFTNNLSKKTQLWQQTNTTILQEHSQRMQDALNVFNKENAQYQANVQAQMAKFQTDAANVTKDVDVKLQTDIQGYTFELQKWQQELTQYQAEVNTEVQAFTQNVQIETQTWQTEQANAIQQYQMETADNMKTADIANQAAIQQGQADLQVAIRDKDKQLEREIQNATNEMQEIIQNNQSLLAKYQAEVSVYQAKVQEEIQENTQNLQKFNADLQAEGIGYQWLQDQYSRLKTEYEQAFATAQPQA
jgi:hypothetical protein